MNKRGISNVVAVTLIILIAVSAVAILWISVIPQIRDNSKTDTKIMSASVYLSESAGYPFYDAKTKTLAVKVKRGSDKNPANLSKISIYVSSSAGTIKFDKPGNFGVNSEEIYYLFVKEKPEKISVAPSIINNGIEKTYPESSSTKKVPENSNADYSKFGLVGYYSFEGNVLDSSGANNNGEIITNGELVTNGGAEFGNESWNFNSGEVTSTDGEVLDGAKSFKVVDRQSESRRSNSLIPVDSAKIYNQSGLFKCLNPASGNCKTYFGFISYDKNQRIISGKHINAESGTETTLYADCRAADTSVKINKINGKCNSWKNNSYGFIAFNVDDSGNYNDLPNFNLSNRNISVIERTNYCEVNFGTNVSVSAPAETKVREHIDNLPSYYYRTINGVDLPGIKTSYSSITFQESLFGEVSGKWRRGTRYVKMLILPNLGSAGGGTTFIDRISLVSLDDISRFFNLTSGNNAFQLEGLHKREQDGYIKIKDSDSLELANGTIGVWVYPFSYINGSGFVSKTSDGSVSGRAWSLGFELASSATGKPKLYLSNGTVGEGFLIDSALPLNAWSHVLYAWNQTQVNMYLNGILIGSSAKIRSVQTNNNFEVNIGRQFNQNQYMFNGKLDEVVIFNRALSSEEVKNLYDGTRKN